MKVLIACECSGRVREAFRLKGHETWSCDLKPSEDNSEFHFQGDVLEFIKSRKWDLMIGHPPCTYLTTNGNSWFKKQPGRYKKQMDALEFFKALYYSPVPKIALENPQGYLSSLFRQPDQTIHPYYFGDPFLKRTCLWLRNLPKLVSVSERDLFLEITHVPKPPPPIHISKDGRAKHFTEMLVRLPKEERATARSRTFQGIASAMAEQWGNNL